MLSDGRNGGAAKSFAGSIHVVNIAATFIYMLNERGRGGDNEFSV